MHTDKWYLAQQVLCPLASAQGGTDKDTGSDNELGREEQSVEAMMLQVSELAKSQVVTGSGDSQATAVTCFRLCAQVQEHCLLLPAASVCHWAGMRQAYLSHLQMQRHALHLQLAALRMCEIQYFVFWYEGRVISLKL